MGRKSKFTAEEKFRAVVSCLKGTDSVYHMSKMLGIDGRTLQQWIRNYESLGIEGLSTTSQNKFGNPPDAA